VENSEKATKDKQKDEKKWFFLLAHSKKTPI
jgi:hypothetical protein